MFIYYCCICILQSSHLPSILLNLKQLDNRLNYVANNLVSRFFLITKLKPGSHYRYPSYKFAVLMQDLHIPIIHVMNVKTSFQWEFDGNVRPVKTYHCALDVMVLRSTSCRIDSFDMIGRSQAGSYLQCIHSQHRR